MHLPYGGGRWVNRWMDEKLPNVEDGEDIIQFRQFNPFELGAEFGSL